MGWPSGRGHGCSLNECAAFGVTRRDRTHARSQAGDVATPAQCLLDQPGPAAYAEQSRLLGLPRGDRGLDDVEVGDLAQPRAGLAQARAGRRPGWPRCGAPRSGPARPDAGAAPDRRGSRAGTGRAASCTRCAPSRGRRAGGPRGASPAVRRAWAHHGSNRCSSQSRVSPGGEPLLELGQARVAQAGRAVLPPDVGVDQLSGHPVLAGSRTPRTGTPPAACARARPAGSRAGRRGRSRARRSRTGSPRGTAPGTPLPRAVSTAAATSAVPIPCRCRSGTTDSGLSTHTSTSSRRASTQARLSPTWPTTTPPSSATSPTRRWWPSRAQISATSLPVARALLTEGGGDHAAYVVAVGRLLGAHLELGAETHATQRWHGLVRCRHGDRVARLPDRSRDAGALRQPGRGPRHPPRGPHAGQPDVLVGQLPAPAGSPGRHRRRRSGGSRCSRGSSRGPRTARSASTARDGSADDLAPFTGLGLDVDESSVMTATSVHAPPRPNTDGDVPDAGVGRRLGPAGRAGHGRRGRPALTTSPS